MHFLSVDENASPDGTFFPRPDLSEHEARERDQVHPHVSLRRQTTLYPLR